MAARLRLPVLIVRVVRLGGLTRTISWHAGDSFVTVEDRTSTGTTKTQVPVGHELPLPPSRGDARVGQCSRNVPEHRTLDQRSSASDNSAMTLHRSVGVLMGAVVCGPNYGKGERALQRMLSSAHFTK
jgi:hypothetical protein